MKARTVRVRQLTTEDESAWHALAERAVEPNPLYEPECLIPAARHQTFGDEIDVVFAEENGRFYGCIPVRRIRKWRGFPYPFVTTAVRRMVYCGTPLVDAERGAEAMAAIFAELRARREATAGRVLILQEVARGGPVDQAVQDGAKLGGFSLNRYEAWERPIVARRPEPTYRTIHGGKFLRNMSRLRRNLNAELGAEVVRVNRSDDPAAVEEVVRLEGAGYKARTGVAMVTVPGEPAYFTEMCDRFRAAGRLHLNSLEVEGTVVAMQLNVRAGSGLFLLKLVYDERFSRFRPGLQLDLDVIDDFHLNTDAQFLDSCTYKNNETLLRMYPDRKNFSSYFVPLSRNPIDALAGHAFVTVRSLHKRAYEAAEARRHQRSTAKEPQSGAVTTPEPESAPKEPAPV